MACSFATFTFALGCLAHQRTIGRSSNFSSQLVKNQPSIELRRLLSFLYFRRGHFRHL